MHNMRTFALTLGLGLAAHGLCAHGPLSASEDTQSTTTEIHVAIDGDDAANGSSQRPVQTLHRAAELVRANRDSSPQLPIQVIVHEGEYLLDRTLELTEADSGSTNAGVSYRPATGERVTLSGAVRPERLGLASSFNSYSDLSPQAAKSVLAYSLPASHEAWSIPSRGEDHGLEPCEFELFASGKVFQRAAIPSEGWSLNREDNPIYLLGQKKLGENVWLHGFPHNDYQDEFLSLESAQSHQWREGSRYRIENVLFALDQPGEWYLDCKNQRLLWWPDGTEESSLRVSNLETLVSLYDVEHVRFDGFTLEGTRVQAVEIAGGYECELQDCVIRCIGNVGVNVFHGERHTIANCEIQATGSSGIRIEGGNRDAKLPADHLCFGNVLSANATKHLSRHAAIAVHGVGVTVSENLIHSQPDWAISLCGDSHTVQQNHIHDVCTQTSDSGAIYLSHDSTYADNLITLNHIHHVGGFDSKNVFGVYLDDQISNTEVSANWIHDVPRAIVVRGGSNNKLLANVIHDCWVGVQFQWSNESASNQLTSNVIESVNSLVVSDKRPQALVSNNNADTVNEVFANAKAGDFTFVRPEVAESVGLTEWEFSKLAESKDRLVSLPSRESPSPSDKRP